MTTLEELERLLKAGTPGPWSEQGGGIGKYVEGRYEWSDIADVAITPDRDAADGEGRANAALIVAAVNALPELLALREENERLREALKFYADPNRWPNMPNPKNPHYDLEMDAGSRARFALHARAALNQEPGQ